MYVHGNPIRYNDPDGHCGPFCWAGIVMVLAGTALMVTADTPLPPEEVPPPEKGVLAWSLLLGGPLVAEGGPAFVTWISSLVCGDGDCTNEAEGVVSRFSQSDTPALERFADEAPGIQAERGLRSFGDMWRLLGQLASERAGVANDLFTYRVGDRIVGAMSVQDAGTALKIEMLEGLGGGAGTELVKTAVQESMARGYGGQITTFAADQAVAFYEKLGFVLVNALTNEYLLTVEAAEKLLQGP